MCECCGGDCKLCNAGPANGYFGFPEAITKVYASETVDKNGCKLEELVINDKYKLIPTGDPNNPFRQETMKQPLNEAYHNEVLEAYQKISDTFDDFTQLMRKRIPYEEWPKSLQIAGVSDQLKGEYESKDNFCKECKDVVDECICHFEDIVAKGWDKCSPQSRPDESFRAMLKIMLSWKKYLDSVKSYGDKKLQITELLKAQGLDQNDALGKAVIRRLLDMGRAHRMLVSALDSPLFENLSKHSEFWQSNHDVEDGKLHDIRCQLSCLHDNLWDVVGILVGEEN